jgi:hypothetical protein
MARRKFFDLHKAVLLIENFDTAALDAAIPFCVAERIRFVLIPKKNRAKADHFLPLPYSDFLAISSSAGKSTIARARAERVSRALSLSET